MESRTQIIFIAVAIALVALFLWLKRADISSSDARALVKDGASLLDVRSPEEYSAGHIDGAVNIPVGELSQRLGELPRDRGVVVYCQSGMRSARAASVLREAGFSNVHNLGGMSRW
jgi:rhodanese-related sulfurtransferase